MGSISRMASASSSPAPPSSRGTCPAEPLSRRLSMSPPRQPSGCPRPPLPVPILLCARLSESGVEKSPRSSDGSSRTASQPAEAHRDPVEKKRGGELMEETQLTDASTGSGTPVPLAVGDSVGARSPSSDCGSHLRLSESLVSLGLFDEGLRQAEEEAREGMRHATDGDHATKESKACGVVDAVGLPATGGDSCSRRICPVPPKALDMSAVVSQLKTHMASRGANPPSGHMLPAGCAVSGRSRDLSARHTRDVSPSPNGSRPVDTVADRLRPLSWRSANLR